MICSLLLVLPFSIDGSGGHYKIDQASMYDPYILTISELEYSDRGFYYCCLPSNCSENVEHKCQRFILRVRGEAVHNIRKTAYLERKHNLPCIN